MTVDKAREMLLDDALRTAIEAEGKLIQAERKVRLCAILCGSAAIAAAVSFAVRKVWHEK